MKCENCKRNFGVTLTCSYCKNCYCTGCIQLEIHNCGFIHVKIEKEKKLLEEKNTRIITPKKI